MKVTKLNDDQLIEHIIPLAMEYRRRFGKSLGITGEASLTKFIPLHARNIYPLIRGRGYRGWG
jgi:hypothetical protein